MRGTGDGFGDALGAASGHEAQDDVGAAVLPHRAELHGVAIGEIQAIGLDTFDGIVGP